MDEHTGRWLAFCIIAACCYVLGALLLMFGEGFVMVAGVPLFGLGYWATAKAIDLDRRGPYG